GMATESADKLGLAQLIEETITMGTAKRSGRTLSDAFDSIGAGRNSGTGRETTTYTCTVLPEHFGRAIELHAEFFRTATFPQDAFEVNVQLAKQELDALEDDAQGLAEKMLDRQAWGPCSGAIRWAKRQHSIGSREKISRAIGETTIKLGKL
ncbi:MAG: insulinase family protein, partial [Planctomycetes bacterium]|nr:insulinase family protein [Planctomycetota bacterium]